MREILKSMKEWKATARPWTETIAAQAEVRATLEAVAQQLDASSAWMIRRLNRRRCSIKRAKMRAEAGNSGFCVRPARCAALLIVGCALLVHVAPRSALAQPAGTQPTLLQRQQDIRQRLQELESRMNLLARVLAESEPDKADRLRTATDLCGQKQIKRRLDDIVFLVKSGDYSAAERAQGELLADLEEILQQLQDTGSDFDRKRAERERLERLKRGIQSLMQQQLEQLYRTQAAAPDGELARRLREQADALEGLAERQAELRKRATGAEQQELADSAEQHAAELDKLRQQTNQAEVAVALEQSAGETQDSAAKMRAASEKLEAQEDAEAGLDQQAAEEQLRRSAPVCGSRRNVWPSARCTNWNSSNALRKGRRTGKGAQPETR